MHLLLVAYLFFFQPILEGAFWEYGLWTCLMSSRHIIPAKHIATSLGALAKLVVEVYAFGLVQHGYTIWLVFVHNSPFLQLGMSLPCIPRPQGLSSSSWWGWRWWCFTEVTTIPLRGSPMGWTEAFLPTIDTVNNLQFLQLSASTLLQFVAWAGVINYLTNRINCLNFLLLILCLIYLSS